MFTFAFGHVSHSHFSPFAAERNLILLQTLSEKKKKSHKSLHNMDLTHKVQSNAIWHGHVSHAQAVFTACESQVCSNWTEQEAIVKDALSINK